MRIGLVNSEFPAGISHGGLSTYYHALANALAGEGHSVLLTHLPVAPADALAAGVETAEVTSSGGGRGLLGRLRDRFSPPAIAHQRALSRGVLRLFCDRHRTRPFDAVQIPEYNALAAEFSQAPFPLVIRFHTPAYLVDRLNGAKIDGVRRAWHRLEAEGVRRARGFTASSQALRDEACRHYGLPPDRVQVIRNPVDTASFRPPAARARGGTVTLFFAGRLEMRKGAALLPAAVKEVLDRHPGARFVFAGSQESAAGTPWLSALRAMGERVKLLGEVPREKLRRLYADADIFFIPSLFDNSPNALFEAMATGLPCAGSDVGGINEIISDGEDGVLFDSGNPAALASALSRLCADAALRARLGAGAREKMEREYAPGRIARQTAEFYASLSPRLPERT